MILLKSLSLGLLLQYAHGDAIDMRGLLESIPVRLTSVREYARTVLEPYKRVVSRRADSLVVNAPHIADVDLRSGLNRWKRSTSEAYFDLRCAEFSRLADRNGYKRIDRSGP
jgi:hypothetical protein